MSQVVDDLRIQEFLRETGASRDDAASYLSRTGWKVAEAAALYNRLHSDPYSTSYSVGPTSAVIGQQRPSSMHAIGSISQQLLPATSVIGQPAASFQKSIGSASQGANSTTNSIDRKKQPAEAAKKQTILKNLPRFELEKSGAIVMVKKKASSPPIDHRPQSMSIQPQPMESLAPVRPIESQTPPPTYEMAVGDWTAVTSLKESSQQSSQQQLGTKPEEDTEPINPPRLVRGLSRAFVNVPLVAIARDSILKDVTGDGDLVQTRDQTADIATEFTFVLPDITRYPEDLRAFLSKDLIESCTLVSLEQGGHLNWWADIGACRRLMPMVTSGDGNCLLHAASLGMWGFHDRQLALRGALSAAMLTGRHRDAFRRRWQHAASIINRQCGLELSPQEWEAEWAGVVRLASPLPRGQGGERRGGGEER